MSHASRLDPRPPGRLLTDLVLRLSLRAGEVVRPTVTEQGARLPLCYRLFGGEGEVIVTAEGEGSRALLEGEPPMFPLSWRWADRTLRALLRPVRDTAP